MTEEALSGARCEAVWELLRERVRPGREREVAVEQALGLVLARDARCAMDYPPFDRAVMDGYAVRSADFSGGRARLRCVALARAGDSAAGAPYSVASETCVQINTGASLPEGADAVVMVERSERGDDDFVTLSDSPTPGQNVERRAGLAQRDGLLAPAGTRINGGALAALVAGGVTRVTCFARPRVAILSTGDELVARGEELNAGQIHDSNSVMLDEMVRQAGGETVSLGRVPDDAGPLRAALELGLGHDVLCVTGGMSKGSHDLAPQTLEQLGVRWLVTSLDLKPGKPTRIGRGPGGAWVLGLPGNPVSCAVCFTLFARPILDGLQGLGATPLPRLAGTLLAEMPRNGARPMFQPAYWTAGLRGEACVMPLEWRGSGDPFGMALATALIYRESNVPASPRGDATFFIPLDRPR